MAKAKKKSVQTQAARLLEALKKAKVDQGEGKFSQAMGKVTMARQARKTSKGQIGG